MRTMNAPIAREKLGKVSHCVRAAQAILQYGVGAMVDFPDQTLITAAPEYWEDNIRHIHDSRLEKALGVTHFGMPKDKDMCKEGIAYARFPQWYFCPKCRTFQSLKKWFNEYQSKAPEYKIEKDKYMKRPVCMKCNPRRGMELVPSRIVVACSAGHLDDFPWVEWVHERSFGERKEMCVSPSLTFKTGANSSAGLEGLVVECLTCKAKANLDKSFNKNALKQLLDNYKCSGFMPWVNSHVNCDQIPQSKQRGASSIYYPKIDSSLVIPPYSERLMTRIQSSEEYKRCLDRIADMDDDERIERIKSRLSKWSKDIGFELGKSDIDILPLLNKLLLVSLDAKKQADESSEVYRHAEYEALTGAILDGNDDGDFVREELSAKDFSVSGLKQVALLHKIREVRALVGFTRLEPPSSGKLGIPDADLGRFQCVKQPETNWYSGYEVRGEGIFLEFDNTTIEEWIATSPYALAQAKKINNNVLRCGKSGVRNITPKFVFLHTLSHMLIRQLSFECGYNSASLRERIYCDIEHPEFPMCGLFIYTASGDAEGTLGGLVRQGRPDCLPDVLKAAIASAMWCSNDPVCIDSGGQGRDGLNMAACHSCMLLPETSCEEYNVYLDRSLIVGKMLDRSTGYFTS